MIKLSFIIFITFAVAYSANTYYTDYNNYLRFHWKGAIQPTSITFKVFPYLDKLVGLNTFLVVYTKENGVPIQNNFISPKMQLIEFRSEAYPVREITVIGLTPKTQYYYTFIFTRAVITIANFKFDEFYTSNSVPEFRFRTFDTALTPYSFSFGAASCAETGSESAVFQHLIDENFDFFMHMGDLHYEDIGTNDANLFYEAYYKVIGSSRQKKFFQNVPTYYVWDDHDFGPNDSEGTSPSKPAATAAFKKFAPYNPLKNRLPVAAGAVAETAGAYLDYDETEGDYGIFRSFVVGRCLFIMLDLRTYKNVVPGDLVGEQQQTWIENQLRFAGNNPNIKMVFIISSVPWISQDEGAIWGDFRDQQEEIGSLIKKYIYDNQKQAMLIAGDAHMVAFDDGRHNQYGGFPVLQAASLDRTPSCKGGPYSHGTNPERGQYAAIKVTDENDKICIDIQTKRFGGNRIAYNTCYSQFYPASKEMECESKFMIWLKTFPGAIYILAFGSLFVFALICCIIFMCRRRCLRRKALAKKKQAEQAQRKEEAKATKEEDIIQENKEKTFAPPAPSQ